MPPTPTDSPGYSIRLNTRAWFAIRKARQLHTDTATARRMGVTVRTLYRVQAGDLAPGPRFIGGALAALGYPPNAVGPDPRCLFIVEPATP
ncbi:MAG TPA: hypothetical protein VFL65_00670 [Jatrophihabitans sp.]|nr:hypothetical protein [Jatrophihabitans sp.]